MSEISTLDKENNGNTDYVMGNEIFMFHIFFWKLLEAYSGTVDILNDDTLENLSKLLMERKSNGKMTKSDNLPILASGRTILTKRIPDTTVVAGIKIGFLIKPYLFQILDSIIGIEQGEWDLKMERLIDFGELSQTTQYTISWYRKRYTDIENYLTFLKFLIQVESSSTHSLYVSRLRKDLRSITSEGPSVIDIVVASIKKFGTYPTTPTFELSNITLLPVKLSTKSRKTRSRMSSSKSENKTRSRGRTSSRTNSSRTNSSRTNSSRSTSLKGAILQGTLVDQALLDNIGSRDISAYNSFIRRQSPSTNKKVHNVKEFEQFKDKRKMKKNLFTKLLGTRQAFK